MDNSKIPNTKYVPNRRGRPRENNVFDVLNFGAHNIVLRFTLVGGKKNISPKSKGKQ